MRTRSMKFAALLAALGVMTLGLSGVMAAPVGAQGYKRVEKITYVGSEVPVPLTGYACEGSLFGGIAMGEITTPPPGPGVGCVWVDTSPGERFVAAAIKDAVVPDVAADLYQVHWREVCPPYFDSCPEQSTWGVATRFCTTTDKPIKLLPDTNRIFVNLGPGGRKCPYTDVSATSGAVTITFTRSR